MAKLFYFDLETTGVKHWKNGIHQIAGVIEIDGVEKEKFELKIQPNPLSLIEDEALAIASVTREDINTYMTFKDGYIELIRILSKYIDKYNKQDKFFLVGYNNASFDNQFLRAFFVQNGDNYFGSLFWSSPIDVFVLASEKLMNERHLMTDFQQGTVAKYLGIHVDENRLHDAVYDVEIMIEIYKKITNNGKDTLQETKKS